MALTTSVVDLVMAQSAGASNRIDVMSAPKSHRGWVVVTEICCCAAGLNPFLMTFSYPRAVVPFTHQASGGKDPQETSHRRFLRREQDAAV